MKTYKTTEETVRNLFINLDQDTVERIISSSFVAEYEKGETVSKVTEEKHSFVLGGGYTCYNC